MNKPDCYKCIYRGNVPGDAHSSCHHPALGDRDSNSFGALVQMMGGKFNQAAKELNIKANPYGLRNGWFMWPANFDPVWLYQCDGFKSKEEKAVLKSSVDSVGG